MPIENWFPTTVGYYIAPAEIKVAIADEYLKVESKILEKLNHTWGDNISTTFNSIHNLIIEENLNVLDGFIKTCMGDYYKYMQCSKRNLIMDSSWVNYSGKNQYQERHCHEPCVISGVYYLRTNGQDGNFRIHPPSWSMETAMNNMVDPSTIEYKPEEGKLILFPSWTPHSVRANLTDSTRVSISFNLI